MVVFFFAEESPEEDEQVPPALISHITERPSVDFSVLSNVSNVSPFVFIHNSI